MAVTTSLSIQLRVICGCLLILTCVRTTEKSSVINPGKAPKAVLQRLKGLESFRFRLSYQTDSPFFLGARLSGAWNAPDHESWVGYYWRGDKRERVSLVGAGDIQYENDHGVWHRSPRGLETEILEQVRQVIRGKQISFVESKGNIYRYRFKPCLPVLDPGQTKSFSGTMEIDNHSGLPVRISCADESGSAEWKLILDRFNSAGRVKIPFVAKMALTIGPSQKVSRGEFNQAVTVLRKRLEELDWDYRLFRRWGKLILQLDRQVSRSPLKLLLSPGKVEIWCAEQLDSSSALQGDSGIAVGGDVSFRVILKQKIGKNGDFEARLRQEFLPEPGLLFAFEDTSMLSRPDMNRLLVLVVNGDILDYSRTTVESGVEFSSLENKEIMRVLAALANQPAMPTGFEAVLVR